VAGTTETASKALTPDQSIPLWPVNARLHHSRRQATKPFPLRTFQGKTYRPTESLDNPVNSAKVQKGLPIPTSFAGALEMKNVYEVLRQKEMELTRLEKEVEALRLVAPLLSEEKESISDISKPLAAAVNGPQPPARVTIPSPPSIPAPQPVRAAGWEDTAKRWP